MLPAVLLPACADACIYGQLQLPPRSAPAASLRCALTQSHFFQQPLHLTFSPASRFMMDSIRSPNKLLVNVSTCSGAASANGRHGVNIPCTDMRCSCICNCLAAELYLTVL